MIALHLALALAAPTSDAVEVPLAFEPYRTWDLVLPAERFTPVGDAIPCARAACGSFAVRLDGTTLRLDRDGDGELDATVEAAEEPGATALMVFRDGQRPVHAIRLASDGKWSYAASGAVVGGLRGTAIRIIDQNNDGTYDDFGADAMIVGPGRAASFLSRVVNVDGALWSVAIDADGTSARFVPYEGASGLLDLASELETHAKMSALVVTSADGELSFELSRADGPVRVPAGEYVLHSGRVVLGKARATLSTGRCEPITVEPDTTATVAWGGPVRAEFAYRRAGDTIEIAPDDVLYYGRAGERYTGFMPLGESPEFVVAERESGEVLVNAKFPGNC